MYVRKNIYSFIDIYLCLNLRVAPYAGAWIEMTYFCDYQDSYESHLTQVRGLKFCLNHLKLSILLVAPYAGAWIEIMNLYDCIVVFILNKNYKFKQKYT